LPQNREEELEGLLQGACDRIKRCTVHGAAQALRELLSGEFDLPAGEEATWLSLYNCVYEASEKRFRDYKWGKYLVNILRERKVREEDVMKIMTKKELSLYRKLENRSPREIWPFIAKYYSIKHYSQNDPKIKLPKFIRQNASWHSLLNYVRALQPSGSTDTDTLISVLLTMSSLAKNCKEKPKTLFTCCSLCWRPVPSRFMGNSGRIFCQFHTYRKQEGLLPQKKSYERGLKIKKKGEVGKMAVSTARKLFLLEDKTWPSNDHHKWEAYFDWFAMWEADPCQALPSLPRKSCWPDADQLFARLPNTASALPPGNLTYPAFLFEWLAPVHPLANRHEQDATRANYEIWGMDFLSYVLMLAHAEAWLDRCKNLHGKIYFPA
jgi:hypothetical protein